MLNVSKAKKLLSVGILFLLLTVGWGVIVQESAEASSTSSKNESAPEQPSTNGIVNAFFDDMESGTNGWNATGFWHRVWNHTGAPSWNISYSGNYSWWYGQDSTGNYDNGSRNYGNLTSPTIVVKGYPVFLNFKGYYETETNGTTPDERRLWISVDNGSFSEVAALSGDSMNIWNNYTYNISDFLKPWYDYELPWEKKGTVMSSSISADIDREISPCVLKENGTYKMWYSGWDSNDIYRILYATSTDGYSWTKHGVVLDVGGVGDSYWVFYPCVIDDNGTYKMWYTGQNTSTDSSKIFYATSPDGINWTKHGVVLSPGPEPYDSGNLRGPWVIKDGNIYKMWYAADNATERMRIFYATSPDGINWTKHGLAINYGDAYESLLVERPSVIKMPDGIYRMWYTARNDDGTYNRYRIKSAYSFDGINWTKRDVEIDYGESYAPDGAGFCSVLLDNSELKMWYTGIDWNGPEPINLAITNVTTVSHSLNIRFTFDTINSINNTYQGWYIDDFCIKEKTPPSVTLTEPSNGAPHVLLNKTVVVVFDRTMNTSVIPTLTQIKGTDPGNWTFLGWSSTNVNNDTAMWSHANWSQGDHISLCVSNYSDYAGDFGKSYEWNFTTVVLYNVSVSPSSQIGVSDSGTTVVYNLTITNSGYNNDTYDLAISGNIWNTGVYDASGTVPISSIRVDSYESKNITVKVEIPLSANPTDYDNATVSVTSQNSSALSEATVNTSVPYSTPLFDNMDNGDIGWKVNGGWERGTPTSGPSSAFSDSNCWGTILGGNYSNYADYILTTPYIHLATGDVKLEFYMWFYSENYYDAGWVEIRDIDSSWTKISPVEGPSYQSSGYGNGYTGEISSWKHAAFDISGYAGKVVQIRFVFKSDGSVTYPGWYIDNIYVGIPDGAPEIYGVRVNGNSSITVEYGTYTTVNLTATIDDSTTGNYDIWGANYTTGYQNWSSSQSMHPTDGVFDSSLESVFASINTSSWSVGTYNLYVYGWDIIPRYNTTSTAYATINIVDTRPPSHSHEWPAQGSYIENTTPTISVHITDASPINTSTIKLYVNGFSVAYALSAIPDGYNVSYYHESGFSVGETVNCRIVAEDIYGNRLDWSWNFTVNGPVNLTVHQGWNLITIPWQSSPTNISAALTGLQWDRAMVYIDGKWYTYDKNRDGRYNLGFPEVDNTIGIWVNCTSSGTINGTNENPGNISIFLHRGWNLVGYPSAHDQKVSDALAGMPWQYLETADSLGNLYALGSSDYMIVGKAYWIYVTEDCVWTVEW